MHCNSISIENVIEKHLFRIKIIGRNSRHRIIVIFRLHGMSYMESRVQSYAIEFYIRLGDHDDYPSVWLCFWCSSQSIRYSCISCLQIIKCEGKWMPIAGIPISLFLIVPSKMAICYIAAQYIGAYMGFGLLKYLTPANIFRPENTTGPGVCSTVPYADLQPIHVFAIEYMATTFLVLICCSVWDPRNTVLQDSTPLKFGFAVATLGCVAVNNLIY